ncbi:MAG: hypothetical protein Q8W45_07595 [Candidatus Palauibacterales bacterium]|nr:hypothetical protein [Candidatus Palauibacterales bacterium]MDP2483131.1 hypothetical protein [Candidatus Palauibacterales bacterium]
MRFGDGFSLLLQACNVELDRLAHPLLDLALRGTGRHAPGEIW